ncbi:MAG: hypothetical protein WCA38_05205 [Candidatus Acidiferrales bacterium]
MKPKMLIAIIAAVLLAVPAVEAQRGGGVSSGGRAVAPAGGTAHVSGARRTSASPSGGVRRYSGAKPLANPFSVYGVPTPYRFSTNNNLGIRVPDGTGSGRRGGNGFDGDHRRHHDAGYPGFFILDGGYWYAGEANGGDEGATQQDAGQQLSEDQSQDNGQRAMRADNVAPAQQPEAESAPLPDVGSYTLILRDGSQVDAIAFTRSDNNVVYITPEGGRRTIAVQKIDVDSTLQINEDRGTPLRTPL